MSRDPRMSSSVAGLQIPPATGIPFSTMAIETQNSGMPCTNSRVPSSGSTTQTRCFVEAGEVVHGFFREPAFARAQQRLAEDVVDGAIGLGDGIVSNFVFGFNGAGSEAVEHRARRFEGGVNAFESFLGMSRKTSMLRC